MAKGEASTGLSIDDLHAILASLAPAERKFLADLVAKGTPKESVVFAQLLHHFPGARIVSDDPLGPP